MAVSTSQLTSIIDPVRLPVSISVEDLSGWGEFLGHREASHYHKLEWREIFQDVMHRELCYLTARTEVGDIAGILPIAITRAPIFGEYAISLPYLNYGGPVGLSDAVEEALIDHAFGLVDELGISHIEIRDTKSRKHLATRTDKVCMVLNLESYDSLDEYLASLPAKVRSQIKKSMRNEMVFKAGKTELLSDFYSVFAHHMRDLGTPVYDCRFFGSILDTFPDDTELVVGYHENAPVSCAFLINHHGRWEIPWASSLRSANRINANMAMYAFVLRQVIERGGQQFDFGRSTRDAPTHKFKKQWGTEELQCYWHYSSAEYASGLSTDNPKYALAIKAWQHLPIPITKLLGPRLVRNLP